MSRRLHPDEARIWGHVAATVRPLPGRVAPTPPPAPSAARVEVPARLAPPTAKTPAPVTPRPPQSIEPGRHRRIVRERSPLDARIDLHGMTYDVAKSALERFLLTIWEDGAREALVITGKGSRGEGIIRRFAPEWLAAPPLREIVAGISPADRRHGGDGALYIALKRRTRT